MRVLFLNYEYPPLGGGAANANAYLLDEYKNVPDLYVDLVTSSVDNQYHMEKIGERISIHRLPIGKNKNNLHFQSQKDLLVYAWKAYFFSRRLIKKNKYDLSHSFFTVPCGFLSLLFKWKSKIPYVVSLRGSDVPGYSERFKLLYMFIRPLARLIWKNAAQVIANSQGLKELALKTNPAQDIGVIFNGVDINNFFPDEKRRDPSRFLITVGASRVTARKGINYLIEAIKILSAEYPNIYFKVLGEGNDRIRLEKLSQELKLESRVDFIGRIPREETAKYYQEADVFVLPSTNEGMSNALLEALASGLPVIVTEVGGTLELVQNGINGYVVPLRDADSIAKALKKMIDDKNSRMRMGNENRKKAESMSWNNVANKYVSIYKSIAK
jgi:glycosyltransferase involved in cell wall biosynthesis